MSLCFVRHQTPLQPVSQHTATPHSPTLSHTDHRQVVVDGETVFSPPEGPMTLDLAPPPGGGGLSEKQLKLVKGTITLQIVATPAEHPEHGACASPKPPPHPPVSILLSVNVGIGRFRP